MASFDIVGLGEPLYEFSQIPGEDRRYLQGFGGDTSNCAIAAARLGAKVAYLTRLGGDEFGRQFLSLWAREGVDTSGVAIDSAAHTGVYFITHTSAGHVFSYLRKGSAASLMEPRGLDLAIVRAAKFLHASGISQAISASACATVFAAVDAARAAGVRVAYDANLRTRLWPLKRARGVIEQSIALADYFLLSAEDAHALWELSDPHAIIERGHAHGVRYVVLKQGADGVVASDGVRRERLAAHKVACVDATGAGDCFAGALLAQLSSGVEFWHGLRYANAAAALATTGYGAVDPLPRPAAVIDLLGAGA